MVDGPWSIVKQVFFLLWTIDHGLWTKTKTVAVVQTLAFAVQVRRRH